MDYQFVCVEKYTTEQLVIAKTMGLFCPCGQHAEEHLTLEGKKICLDS